MLRKLFAFFISSLIGFAILYGCYSIFVYFTFATPPTIVLEEALQDQHYKTILPLTLHASSDYKLREIKVSINNQEIPTDELKCSGLKKLNAQLNLPVEHLDNGTHLISIQVKDKSYKANSSTLTDSFTIDKEPLILTHEHKEIETEQGKTIHISFESNKPLTSANARALGNDYLCYKKSTEGLAYEAFIPVECEQIPTSESIIISAEDKAQTQTSDKITLKVKAANFPKQRGFTVSKKKLEVEKEASMSNKVLQTALMQWLKHSSDEKLWNGPFIKPIEVQRMTTPFGEIRTTPERGRYHHKGVDLVNRPKSVVWAAQNGKVIIKDRYLTTGNTVVLDHGRKIFSMYCHLEDFADIDVGELVKKGNPLGRLGMTGYADGYHLHWELRINNISVDPFEWTENIY